MNLPKHMTANNYDKIVNRLNIIVKEVANETIRDASEDLLSKIKDPNEDTVIDTSDVNIRADFVGSFSACYI